MHFVLVHVGCGNWVAMMAYGFTILAKKKSQIAHSSFVGTLTSSVPRCRLSFASVVVMTQESGQMRIFLFFIYNIFLYSWDSVFTRGLPNNIDLTIPLYFEIKQIIVFNIVSQQLILHECQRHEWWFLKVPQLLESTRNKWLAAFCQTPKLFYYQEMILGIQTMKTVRGGNKLLWSLFGLVAFEIPSFRHTVSGYVISLEGSWKAWGIIAWGTMWVLLAKSQSGTISSANGTNHCKVSVIINNIKPYQKLLYGHTRADQPRLRRLLFCVGLRVNVSLPLETRKTT